jgi:hypothetical protein
MVNSQHGQSGQEAMVPGEARAKKQFARRDRHEFAAEERAGQATAGMRKAGCEKGDAKNAAGKNNDCPIVPRP